MPAWLVRDLRTHFAVRNEYKIKETKKEQSKIPRHSPKASTTNVGGITTATRNVYVAHWPGSSASRGGTVPSLLRTCSLCGSQSLKCKGRRFYRGLSQVKCTCQNKLNSITGDSGHVSSIISAPQPVISGIHAHSAPASPSTHSHSSQLLCLCTPIY